MSRAVGSGCWPFVYGGLRQEVLLFEGLAESEVTSFQCRAEIVRTWILSDIELAFLIDANLLLRAGCCHRSSARLRGPGRTLLIRVGEHGHRSYYDVLIVFIWDPKGAPRGLVLH